MKKTLSIIFAMAVLVSIFVACGGKDEATHSDLLQPEKTFPVSKSDTVSMESEKTSEPYVPLTPRYSLASQPYASTEEFVAANRVIPENLPQYVPGSIIVNDAETLQRNSPLFSSYYPPSYRYRYYEISDTGVEDLVDFEQSKAWTAYAAEKFRIEVEPTEMKLVTFVKYFQISRKDFDEAVERWSSFRNYDPDIANLEICELPNADIIYTFDNDIINEYYRRE